MNLYSLLWQINRLLVKKALSPGILYCFWPHSDSWRPLVVADSWSLPTNYHWPPQLLTKTTWIITFKIIKKYNFSVVLHKHKKVLCTVLFSWIADIKSLFYFTWFDTGLVWFDLLWFGLVWFNLVWFGLVSSQWIIYITESSEDRYSAQI